MCKIPLSKGVAFWLCHVTNVFQDCRAAVMFTCASPPRQWFHQMGVQVFLSCKERFYFVSGEMTSGLFE